MCACVVCAGVIGQHGMMSPPATSQQQQQFGSVGSMRLPMTMDQLSNTAHLNSAGVALVKPVPQQSSPVGVRVMIVGGRGGGEGCEGCL